MEDFTKKKMPLRIPVTGKATQTPLSKLTELDLNKEGMFRLPNPQSPTGSSIHELVGIDPGKLAEKRVAFLKMRNGLLRDINSEWTCTNHSCKLVTMGKDVRLKKPTVDGGEGMYVCMRCGEPVVRSRDALDVTKPMRGSIIT
jgi:hypothetical protein